MSSEHPVQGLLNRVEALEADKQRLLATIEQEGEDHRRRVRALKARIAQSEAEEAELLQQHKEKVLEKKRLEQAAPQFMLPVDPARVSAPHAPYPGDAASHLTVGREVRVRDTPDEDWKYGVVAQYSGTTPLIRLNGWQKLLSWNFVEPRPA